MVRTAASNSLDVPSKQSMIVRGFRCTLLEEGPGAGVEEEAMVGKVQQKPVVSLSRRRASCLRLLVS